MTHWTDDYITYDSETEVWVGWDETGADVVLSSPQRSFVVAALVEYEKRMGDDECSPFCEGVCDEYR